MLELNALVFEYSFIAVAATIIFTLACLKRRDLLSWLPMYILLSIGFVLINFENLVEELSLISYIFIMLSVISIFIAVVKEYYYTFIKYNNSKNRSIVASVSVLNLAISGILVYTAEQIICNNSFGSLTGSSGESSYMDSNVSFKSLTGEAISSAVVPAYPIRVTGNLPTFTGTSFLYNPNSNVFAGDIKVPVPKVNASFGMFGDINVSKYFNSSYCYWCHWIIIRHSFIYCLKSFCGENQSKNC